MQLKTQISFCSISKKARTFTINFRDTIARWLRLQWPENFIKELSWELDDNTNFFNDSPPCGLAYYSLPVFKRPFIRINNISYCFDYYSFY